MAKHTHTHEEEQGYNPEEEFGEIEESPDKYQGKEMKVLVQGPSEDDVIDILDHLKTICEETGLDNMSLDTFEADPDGGFEAQFRAHNWNPISWAKDKIEEAKAVPTMNRLDREYGEDSADEQQAQEEQAAEDERQARADARAQAKAAQDRTDTRESAERVRRMLDEDPQAAAEAEEARISSKARVKSRVDASASPVFNTPEEQQIFERDYKLWYDTLKTAKTELKGPNGEILTPRPLNDAEEEFLRQQALDAASGGIEKIRRQTQFESEAYAEGVEKTKTEWRKVKDEVSGKTVDRLVTTRLSPAGMRMETANVRYGLAEADLLTNYNIPFQKQQLNFHSQGLEDQAALRPLQHALNRQELLAASRSQPLREDITMGNLGTTLAAQPIQEQLILGDLRSQSAEQEYQEKLAPMQQSLRTEALRTNLAAQPKQRELILGDLNAQRREQKKAEFADSKTGKVVGAAKGALKTLGEAPGLGHGMAIMAKTLTKGRPTSTYTGDFYGGSSASKMKSLRTQMPTVRNSAAAQALIPDRSIPAARALTSTSNLAGDALVPRIRTTAPVVTEEGLRQGIVLPRMKMKIGYRRKKQPGVPEIQ